MYATPTNNKRIAKNTIILYMRMIVVMLINLYVSRVVLNSLGVSDYGTYNAVGGIVALFSIISGSLTAAITRFITFELGKGDESRLKEVFTTSVYVQIILALIIVVASEAVGVWFLNTHMNIPEGRMNAANWVFQCSIVTFAINIISIPYSAIIIADEKMNVYAYISMFEAVLKLGVAFLLTVLLFDRLKTYAVLMCLAAIIVRSLYIIYCRKRYPDCRVTFQRNKALLKEMISFAGWNIFGNGSWVLMTQGVNLLINIFFGVTVNAARGIAAQVDSAVNQFSSSFTTAINPQITKSYAAGERDTMHTLICKGARFSFYLMFLVSLPILVECDIILKIWLKTVPDFGTLFVRLTLMVSLLSVLSNTLITALLATGKVRNCLVVLGSIGMLVFPLAWIFFRLGFPAYWAYIINFVIFGVQLGFRLYFAKRMIGLPPMKFVKDVLAKVFIVATLSSIIPVALHFEMVYGIARFLVIFFVSVLMTALMVYALGLEPDERGFVNRKVNDLFHGRLKRSMQ